jgi:carboxymethylenebutenolidase
VSDKPDSPHRLLRPDSGYLVAIARDDDAKQPAAKTALRESADAAQAFAEIEVYPADHGWCVPDSPAYNAAEADRAWGRLLALYQRML